MPPRERAVYLHIGPPKTGTTYLQDILWHHRDELVRQGLTFPGKNQGAHFHAALDLRGIAFGGYDNPATAGAWNRLVEATRDAPTDGVVISHEVFSGATAGEIERLGRDLTGAGASGRDLHVLVGARDLARQLPAVWQESLKNRRTRGYGQFLTQVRRARGRQGARTGPPSGFWRAQDTRATLERWSSIVTPQRLHVLTLPQSGAEPDLLWQRFAGAVGVDTAPFDPAVARPNASLGWEDCELLRRLNGMLSDDLPWPTYERLVKRRFNRLANERRRGAKVLVPESYRDWLTDEAEQTIHALRAGGFDVVGDLDDLVPADSSFGSDDELVDAAASVTDAEVAALADQVGRQARSTWRTRGGRVG